MSRFGKRLMGFIRQRVNSEADAEDILQDVWYQLTTAVDTGPIEQISGWLFAVARNRIIDGYRRKRPESLEDLQSGAWGNDPDNDELNIDSIFSDNSRNPEAANLRALFWKALQEALDELPEEQRSVFVWHELDGISFKEMAEITGENVNTLISRKRYAVVHLRERLLDLYREIVES
jgi:RNA polymerase sigma factor (sigma-70 family)